MGEHDQTDALGPKIELDGPSGIVPAIIVLLAAFIFFAVIFFRDTRNLWEFLLWLWYGRPGPNGWLFPALERVGFCYYGITLAGFYPGNRRFCGLTRLRGGTSFLIRLLVEKVTEDERFSNFRGKREVLGEHVESFRSLQLQEFPLSRVRKTLPIAQALRG